MIANYLDMLSESLEKKLSILIKIEEQNKHQESILKQSQVPFEEFEQTVDIKAELASELIALDEGFEKLYDRIREELLTDKEKYKNQILKLKKLIAKVTEKSIAIQAQEARNKQLAETFFLNEKRNIKSNKKNSAAAYNYYKNMSKGNVVLPQYMDKKK